MTSPANATTGGGGRTYGWPPRGPDAQYTSVTTAKGIIANDALKFWAAKVVAEWAYDHFEGWSRLPREAAVDTMKREPLRYTGKRAGLGDRAHDYAESFGLGQELRVPADPALAPFVVGLVRFFYDFKPVFHYIETTVYSDTHGYAGTLDFGATFPEFPELGLVLGDWKSGKGVYDDVALQLAAYAHADFIGLPDGKTELPVPGWGSGMVVHILPYGTSDTLPDLGEGTYEALPVRIDDATFETFLDALRLQRGVKALKGAVGKPIARR
jgi:hypothetical protein